jgi:hypothetical protein
VLYDLRVRCDSCQAEHLVAFSCKKRGYCPSCARGQPLSSTISELPESSRTVVLSREPCTCFVSISLPITASPMVPAPVAAVFPRRSR